MYLDIRLAYLVLTIPFMAVWLVLFLMAPPASKRCQLFRSLFAMPMGPALELFYFKDYWRPESILTVDIFSIPVLVEDLMFAFAVAGIGSVSYEVICGKMRVRDSGITAPRKAMLFFTLSCAVYVMVGILTVVVGINSIFATMAALAVMGSSCLVKRRDLLRPALFTSLFLGTVLIVIYFMGFLFVHNAEQILREWWFLYGERSGLRLWHVPATEILWAISYGFACPVIFAAATRSRFA